MNKLVTITIDTEVLAISNECTREQANLYFDMIINLSQLLPEDWISLCLSQDAKKILENIGIYPTDEVLWNLIDTYGNKQIPHKEIIKAVNDLFNPNLWLEEYFQLTVDKLDRTNILPNSIYSDYDEALKNNFIYSVSMIAFIKKYCKMKFGDQYLLLNKKYCEEIEISAHITRFLSLLENMENIKPPQDISEKIKIFTNLSEVLNAITFDDFFNMNISDSDFDMAIKIRNYQFKNEKNNKDIFTIVDLLNQPLKVKIGSEFLQGCIEIVKKGCSANQIFDVIIKKNNGFAVDNDEPMDDEKGRPRIRGKDRYWRCRFNANFRMHYWRCHDEIVELSLALDHLKEGQSDKRVSYT
ncbi:hypothetical protein TREPR_2286 [Treponema primitia ZAS-2]|uniref:Uncharacterized protein n=1 Tax=Treponema primitia (strain ATCC BAA-887 / DSM 12427 / ZAS-2) TaxID=545694 RepID=F5YI17_TREPZ|nr:hypothetical protein [Treponema primitia]AEF86103.1 hypothetical protein TREPR_2286 [Treponema primitia ZAS-2]